MQSTVWVGSGQVRSGGGFDIIYVLVGKLFSN